MFLSKKLYNFEANKQALKNFVNISVYCLAMDLDEKTF